MGTLDEEWSRHTGVTKQDLRAQAELHLRGVPGLSITEDAPACLSFRVTGDLELEERPLGPVPTYLGYVQVGLHQSAQLSRRGPFEKVVEVPGAVTWEAGYLFSGEEAPFGDPRAHMEKLVRDLMDQFVTDYFGENPELWPSES